MICIYGLKCPAAGVIRYVGKSSNPEKRRRAHIIASLRGDYDHHTARWVRKLAADGLEPELVILHRVVQGERWQDVERAFIASAKERGWRLTNSTAGGEGLDYIDPVARDRFRRNLSLALKKVWNTPARREYARQRSIKAWADPEITARRLVAMKVGCNRPEVKAKLAAVMAEINRRPETKKAKSRTLKKRWADPVERRKRIAAANHEKMSASAIARWKNPAKCGDLLALRKTPEFRKILSDAAYRRATPAYRAMMAEKTRLSWHKRSRKRQKNAPVRTDNFSHEVASVAAAGSWARRLV